MRVQGQASPAEVAGLGLSFAAAGVYFVLAGFGVLPLPNIGPSPPIFIVLAGAAFLLAGGVAITRASASASHWHGDLHSTTPHWTYTPHRVAAIASAGALALIGTFAAISTGPRAFDLTGPLIEMRTTGELVGRTVFALGAVIGWIYLFALTISTVRKLFR